MCDKDHIPEAVRRLPGQWQEECDDLLAGDDGMQEYLRGKRDAGHELDRALAQSEQGLSGAVSDAAAYGTGFAKSGKRIYPQKVYKDPPHRIPDETRAHLHDLADYYSRSVKNTCIDANYALPHRILGRVAIDMRLCAEASYWWGVAAAPQPEEGESDEG